MKYEPDRGLFPSGRPFARPAAPRAWPWRKARRTSCRGKNTGGVSAWAPTPACGCCSNKKNSASSACVARGRGSDLHTCMRAAGNVRPPPEPGQLLHSTGSTRTHTLHTVEPRIALQLNMQRARARCRQQRARIRAADATLASANPLGLHRVAARALCGERERGKTGKGSKV